MILYKFDILNNNFLLIKMKKYYYFYKLACNDCDDVYIGKTTGIYARLGRHKHCCNNSNSNRYNLKVYKCMRENGGWNNWLMYVIDEGKYSVDDSKKIERKYIDKYGTLNKCIPGRSIKESDKQYRLKNKDKKKAYRLKNKEKNKAYQKQYYLKNKK